MYFFLNVSYLRICFRNEDDRIRVKTTLCVYVFMRKKNDTNAVTFKQLFTITYMLSFAINYI